ncbi:hypothetical protein DJICPGNB_25955 [Escherichia coli]|nr:hypothetical protein DJICPGNB_25955 [Escherichia coli]
MPPYEASFRFKWKYAAYGSCHAVGVEGFVIDRTPADVMAYPLDLVGHTNEDRCIELALDIEKGFYKAATYKLLALLAAFEVAL